MTAPEISCVIPAYERADLVARCLTSIAAQREVRAELIVTDDSRSKAIADVVAALAPLTPPVRYLAGARTGNPVENWNAGLEAASAPLRLLAHQDEFIVDPLYLRRAVDALGREPRSPATRAGVAVIGVERPSRFASVAPLARRLPGARRLLPLINWIGPTAAFVFRAGPLFDPGLVQLADVEFYARVLESGPLVALPGVSVASLGHHDDQISARIDPIARALEDLAAMASRSPARVTPLEHAAFAAALRLKGRLA